MKEQLEEEEQEKTEEEFHFSKENSGEIGGYYRCLSEEGFPFLYISERF